MTDQERAAMQQALECLKGVARGKYDGNAAGVCAALEAALAQQAEPEKCRLELWAGGGGGGTQGRAEIVTLPRH